MNRSEPLCDAGCTKKRRSTSVRCLRVGQRPPGGLSSTESGITEQRDQRTTARYAVRVWPSGWPTRYESWDTSLTCESGLILQHHEGCLSAMEPVNPADLMTKHLYGKRLVMLCALLNTQSIGGRPSSAPMLTMGTEYISRASRALAAITLVRHAAANEIAVPFGDNYGTWTDEHRTDMEEIWKNREETIDNGKRTLEEGRCSQDACTIS